jgi:hypothetical protein
MFTSAVLYRIGILPQSYRFQLEEPAGYIKAITLMS